MQARIATLLLTGFLTLAAQTPERPNVILILTDNHGAWTLGAYGNRDIRTPHIDRLAGEGVLFTRAHANNAVCSPTRASLLTGLMPSQHGVHTLSRRRRRANRPRSAYNTLEEFATIPSILTGAGYVAGLSGKWHLGDNLHPQEGFFLLGHQAARRQPGFLRPGNHRKRATSYRAHLPHPKFWTDHGIRFIEQNKERPFFLYLAYNGPYGLGNAMREPIRNRFASHYARHPLPSMPRDTPHPWNFNYGEWLFDMQVRRKYAAEVSGIDDGVGRIMDTLQRLGLDENTLVIFTRRSRPRRRTLRLLGYGRPHASPHRLRLDHLDSDDLPPQGPHARRTAQRPPRQQLRRPAHPA